MTPNPALSSPATSQASHNTNSEHANYTHQAHANISAIAQDWLGKVSEWLAKRPAKLGDMASDEILLTVFERQINDALKQFVVDNVDMVLDLHLRLFDDYFTLSVSVDVAGIFANVESDFRLTHAQMDAQAQRMVFQQISDTRINYLHSQKSYLPPLAHGALFFYKKLFKKDALPFILHQIKIKGVPFVTYKDQVIYLEIGRWLRKNQTIIDTLAKVQINYGTICHRQLILYAQINYAQLLNFGADGSDIITAKDAPHATPHDDAHDNDNADDDAQEDTTPDTTHAPTRELAKRTGNALPAEALARTPHDYADNLRP